MKGLCKDPSTFSRISNALVDGTTPIAQLGKVPIFCDFGSHTCSVYTVVIYVHDSIEGVCQNANVSIPGAGGGNNVLFLNQSSRETTESVFLANDDCDFFSIYSEIH